MFQYMRIVTNNYNNLFYLFLLVSIDIKSILGIFEHLKNKNALQTISENKIFYYYIFKLICFSSW